MAGLGALILLLLIFGGLVAVVFWQHYRIIAQGRVHDEQIARITDLDRHARAAIEERSRLITEVESSEKRFRTIVDQLPNPVVTIDREGKISQWNPAAESAFGWKKPEVVAQELAAILLPPKYRQPHRDGLKRFLETGHDEIFNRKLHFQALHRDGSEVQIELIVKSVRGNGSDWSFIGYMELVDAA